MSVSASVNSMNKTYERTDLRHVEECGHGVKGRQRKVSRGIAVQRPEARSRDRSVGGSSVEDRVGAVGTAAKVLGAVCLTANIVARV